MLTRAEANRLKDALARDFMCAARCFDPGAVNCVAVTNAVSGGVVHMGDGGLAVQVGTKAPLTPAFRKEIEDCAEKELGRPLRPDDLQYTVNLPYKPSR